MNIRFLWKDSDSITGECPALYEVDGTPASYIVQGKKLSSYALARVQGLSDGQTAVFVPANVLDRLWNDRALCSGESPVLPAIDIAGIPGYIVLGEQVSSDVLARLRDVADDETAVFVPADVLNQGKILV